MSGLKIPDTGRLLVDVLPIRGSASEMYPRCVIRAWRTGPDERDTAMQAE